MSNHSPEPFDGDPNPFECDRKQPERGRKRRDLIEAIIVFILFAAIIEAGFYLDKPYCQPGLAPSFDLGWGWDCIAGRQ